MTDTDRIVRSEAWIVRFRLDRPIALGRWSIAQREYAVLELETERNARAAAYALTRDADMRSALDALVENALGRDPLQLLTAPAERDGLAAAAMTVASPIEDVRAAALLDACAWDLRAQARDAPLWTLLADGEPPVDPRPAIGVAVCGYPTGDRLDARTVAAEVEAGLEAGYTHFKIPGLGTVAEVDARLAAMRALDDELEIIVDLEAAQESVPSTLERALKWERHRLLWIEDPFPPVGAGLVPSLIEQSPIAVAIGDEWREPEIRSLVRAPGPAPLLRLDFATLGGLSVSRSIARAAAAPVAQHIYPELQRHLVHAGLAVPQLDIYRPQPVIDFADRLLGSTATTGGRQEAPRGAGPCMELDRELVAAHASWHTCRRAT